MLRRRLSRKPVRLFSLSIHGSGPCWVAELTVGPRGAGAPFDGGQMNVAETMLASTRPPIKRRMSLIADTSPAAPPRRRPAPRQSLGGPKQKRAREGARESRRAHE